MVTLPNNINIHNPPLEREMQHRITTDYRAREQEESPDRTAITPSPNQRLEIQMS